VVISEFRPLRVAFEDKVNGEGARYTNAQMLTLPMPRCKGCAGRRYELFPLPHTHQMPASHL
jgi:hypothetical protein